MRPFVPSSLPVKLDWERMISLIGPANRALANFNGVLYGLPNAEILLSPLTTQEAVLSSKIEGTQATLGEVLKFEAGERPDEQSKQVDIQEILNYRRALRRAEQELSTRPFSLNLLLTIHSILLDSVRGVNKGRGQFRTSQNWIGPPGCKIEDATFVPPDPSHLPGGLDNFEKYYHFDRPDQLIQLAVLHAQFEIIHPFLDGNGRIGRLLVPLYLFEKGLLSRPVFYLSAYLESHRDEYVERLRTLHNASAWNEWVQFFLTAITHQAEKNLETARRIIDLYGRLKEQVIGITHSQYAVPLLDRLFDMPIFSTRDLEGRSELPSRQTVTLLLNKLKEAGILTILRVSSGRRPQVLAFPELLNLCEGREVL